MASPDPQRFSLLSFGSPPMKSVPYQQVHVQEVGTPSTPGYSPYLSYGRTTINPKGSKSPHLSTVILLQTLGTLVLTIFITGFIITVAFAEIIINQQSKVDQTVLTIYTMCITAGASVCAFLIEEMCQQLLIRRVNERIHRALDSPDQAPEWVWKKINSRWRVILRASSVAQKFGNLHVTLLYLAAGIVTTCIVSACAPSTTTRQSTVTSFYPSGAANGCLKVNPTQADLASCSPQSFWQLSNGSRVSMCPSQTGCPTRNAVPLSGLIHTANLTSYAYADQGVAILPSAIGASSTIYSPDSKRAKVLAQEFQQYGKGLAGLSQCAPVLTTNPVSCRPGGQLNYSSTAMTVTSPDGRCTFTQSSNTQSSSTTYSESANNPLAINTICTNDDVGQSTLVFGATWSWGYRLAQTINDQTYLSKTSPSGTAEGYVLTCTIDANAAIAQRKVSLEISTFDPDGSGYAKKVSAGTEPCDPSDIQPLGPAYAAYVALAPSQLLLLSSSTANSSASLDALAELSTTDTGAPRNATGLAFSSSKNALEDSLGMLCGQVMARMSSSPYAVPATITSTYYRVGNGQRWTTIYAIPSALCSLAMMWLLATALKSRTGRWRSDNLLEIMVMGRSMNAGLGVTNGFEPIRTSM